jgi:hypothetical protein
MADFLAKTGVAERNHCWILYFHLDFAAKTATKVRDFSDKARNIW